jgi:hypothetical protein
MDGQLGAGAAPAGTPHLFPVETLEAISRGPYSPAYSSAAAAFDGLKGTSRPPLPAPSCRALDSEKTDHGPLPW